jgi:hypothetical protein
MMKQTLFAAATAALIALATQSALARVKVTVEFDKAFDFKSVSTWGWHPDGPGEVKMARTVHDDPAAMQKYVEPIVLDAVPAEMTRRGMTRAAADPHLTVHYYLLLTTNMSAQTIGQFLPATTSWGLPPFAQATQSLEMMNSGSLVLDLSAKGTVVWRGVAQANIKMDATDKKRESLLREGVRDLLKKFPPKQ